MKKWDQFDEKIKFSDFDKSLLKKVDLFFMDLFKDDLMSVPWDVMHCLSGNILISLIHNICLVLFDKNDLQATSFFIDQIMVFSKRELLNTLKEQNTEKTKKH